VCAILAGVEEHVCCSGHSRHKGIQGLGGGLYQVAGVAYRHRKQSAYRQPVTCTGTMHRGCIPGLQYQVIGKIHVYMAVDLYGMY